MMQEDSAGSRFLTFTLGEIFFAINIHSVREILDLPEITRIPGAPEYMRGVVNVRGTAVPVMDLRMKFGLGQVEKTVNTRVVIVEIAKKDSTAVVGALADSVKEVLELEPEAIDPPPSMGAAVRTDYVRGIGKHGGRFLLILDVEKVLTSEDIQDVARIVEEASTASPGGES
ncbi:chemotaxis protein CheW [Desulfolutivibrio sulfoxidireducens]|uniref:chemotaxis protein CheW n=1 Tax=Desulfolutivibrio sulfoxidireducens TaxID=2773299 RepID=UPI00159DE9DE|nr:chemotaxis protein CheW [Desulfolutivibrio sulfoxidireducens]QLA15572.1 chemotaxis protein CheW [Desulfolutivibrio sulfoxidireducens]QLA19175.1 chemotaxis protein CheW [Desulfolutivibrio sulfoxidireducens]